MITLEKLYELQNELDELIVAKATDGNIDGNNKMFLNDRIIALFTEVGEFANATRCFKYWSNKPQESRERLLDEYADILHFVLSIGNTMEFTPLEIEEAYHKKYAENIKRQREGY